MHRRTTVLAGLLFVVASLTASAQDAPFRLELIDQGEGTRATDIRLVTPADGYLLLLHVVGGKARVMYPVQPGSSSALASGEYNLDRLGADMPYANGARAGIIVAAWSSTPIRTAELVRYGHWATSDLSRRAFTEDPAGATINLVTSLGATPGMVAVVEYGSVAGVQENPEKLAVRHFRQDGLVSQEWLVYQNLIRIQGRCPSGTRDVTGAGEFCSAPSAPPRKSAQRPMTELPNPEPIDRPIRPVYSPPPANPPPAATPRSVPPPPSNGGKKPL